MKAIYTSDNVRRDAKPLDEAATEAVVDFERLVATVEYVDSLKAIIAKNHKRDLVWMRAAKANMVVAERIQDTLDRYATVVEQVLSAHLRLRHSEERAVELARLGDMARDAMRRGE